RLVLVKAQMDVAADEVAALRIAAADRPFDLSRQRIVRPSLIAPLVTKKRLQLAGSRVADTHHQGVFRGVVHPVFTRRLETAFDAELGGIGGARKGGLCTIGESPVSGSDWLGLCTS